MNNLIASGEVSYTKDCQDMPPQAEKYQTQTTPGGWVRKNLKLGRGAEPRQRLSRCRIVAIRPHVPPRFGMKGEHMTTVPFLNKYERARLIGARALQLAFGAPPLIEVKGENSPMSVALRELDMGIIPLVVMR